ncbi:hypothetical protein NM208_g15495 [Fusarium decemcellulare]|uniref:Uncharacterized protein n=1 Tax=Fusarium decemcellulare TaxID=57161 RepID=A0ACC1REC7_9HYPO|nr:hypothetical protein NM208_g15495 [Fusarium decemcellulare]
MLPLLSQGSPNGDIPGRRPDLFEDPSPPVSKPSRKQVSRACDHCRARRVKCDHGNPCRPCRQKGLLCNSRGKFNDEARTLPQALEEIERLRRRIQELESQLEEARRQASAVPTPSNSSPSTLDLQTQPTGSSVSSTTSKATVPKKTWEGICTAAGRSEQTSYYGPSSSHYFIGRIGAFLNKALYQSFRTCQLEPRGMNMTLAGPTIHDEATSKTDRRGDVPKPSMSRTQEEYFLNLFWESHHANLPIIQEDEFRKLYDSLWTSVRSYRKPSALVDIVLAISMQYGCAFLLRSSPNSEKHCHDDPSIAGRWYYRRCQTLLASELESPSITTLQCHLFSITYLCCASFQNMAHSTLAVAIRTAQTLGLHLEPPASMPRAERELPRPTYLSSAMADYRHSDK